MPKTYKELLKENLIHKKINVLNEDEYLSNPVDLNPSVIDNIDPKETLNNKLDFINHKLEDLLASDPEENKMGACPLNNKFDIDEITLTTES
jgi:hypothetical protein